MFFLIMLFGSLKNLEKFEYSLTFYMNTMKSCFSSNLRKKIYKQPRTKKYISLPYMSRKINLHFFPVVTSVTVQFLKINVAYSNDLNRGTIY